MRTKSIIRLISIVGTFAVVASATEALAAPPKASGCAGAVFTAGGTPDILINRPPPHGICNPSA